MVERLHLPFAVLSGARLQFATALRLPTFTASGHVLLKRMILIIDNGTIRWVFYPVASPEQNPQEVLAWLRTGQ